MTQVPRAILKFSANLGMLFPELSFLDRISAAADAGFSAVEFPFPYDIPAEKIAQRCQQAGQKVVLFNLPPGNLSAGDRGFACDPRRREQFRKSLIPALHYAQVLGCSQLNCLAGMAPRSGGVSAVTVEAMESALIENLKFAADALAHQNLKLLTEPINTQDMPGFYLNRSAHALRVIGAVGRGNLKLQYDIYHMQLMEGELASSIGAHIGQIGHFQIADAPGRHEPGTGTINYSQLFRLIEKLNFQGWIGCEYHPLHGTQAGLAWMEKYR